MIDVLAQPGVSFVEELTSNFWLSLLLKTVLVLGFFLVVPLGVGYMEHKVLAHMQSRLGPMEAGAFHGWAQLIADGVKFIQKENVVPAAADRTVFTLAPAVAMVPYIAILVVLPFSDTLFALEPRRRHLLRDGHVERVGDRRAHGRVVEREQVLADRGPARGGAADRLRAAARAGRRGRRDALGRDLDGRHRRGAGVALVRRSRCSRCS